MVTADCTFGLEQTIDQFFKLNLPMRLPQLKGLTSGFDNALQHYTNRVVSQLGNSSFPPTPYHVVVIILSLSLSYVLDFVKQSLVICKFVIQEKCATIPRFLRTSQEFPNYPKDHTLVQPLGFALGIIPLVCQK